jgi:4-hydroxy-2-oxoheptanedioate aldolase
MMSGMRTNDLKRLLVGGSRGINGWVAIPDAFTAEQYAAQGWDSVTVDLQHGAADVGGLIPLLQAIGLGGATPMVRVPWNDPAYVMRVLDAGAYGVICPMVNDADQARAFVSAGRYPPLGSRSAGPFRASHHAGADYVLSANDEILLLAMIETREAFENLDAILQVEGLDGVYVGPSDLSLSLGKPSTLAPDDPEVLETMAAIAAGARRYGMIAGVHTDGPATARQRYEQGFHFCSLMNDIRLLVDAARRMVSELRGAVPADASTTY